MASSSSSKPFPTLRLIYFDLPGRAEAIRLAFLVGKVPYEDARVSFSEFLVMKSSGELPLDQLPVLLVDGTPFAQSMSILRYVGKLSGLYPTDPKEALCCDQVLDTIADIFVACAPFYNERDVEKKAAIGRDLAHDTFPRYLQMLESTHRASGDFLAGKSLSVADLAFATTGTWLTSGSLTGVPRDLLSKYPRLQDLVWKVYSIPSIEQYYAARPPLTPELASPRSWSLPSPSGFAFSPR